MTGILKTQAASDISGKEIRDLKDAVTRHDLIRDVRKGLIRLEALASEVAEPAGKGWNRNGAAADPKTVNLG
jgi:hypothetical protein